ncbi:hypothetical protein JOD31_000299 [Methylopila capsulata]|uniref:Uncharacterized protein n=1 Tax=Methylopila capsulata TaxID=61654 RepID=A0A9W6MRL4_9HYPH|nr:hypothetical protein [Methylopila capsulata]MBM7850087.1 hypothetical protein [Methylopila capsulata]GLK55378.1 hypothetical protein GCM10008170_13970 [Methylopila capsulata]
MFYVLETAKTSNARSIDVGVRSVDTFSMTPARPDEIVDYAEADIDFVDDSMLNTAPHNPIERQLLTGDMIGLALMSGAIIWSAMGAIA